MDFEIQHADGSWHNPDSPDYVPEAYPTNASESVVAEQAPAVAADREVIHRNLIETVPELYEARLPRDMEDLLGDTPYAIGFNQTLGVDTSSDALLLLKNQGGVGHTDYVNHRFELADKDMDVSVDSRPSGQRLLGEGAEYMSHLLEEGHYSNSAISRIVGVFPEAHPEKKGSGQLFQEVGYNSSILPDDLIATHVDEEGDSTEVVSNKYIAGVIDGNGVFWQNLNFMRSTEPDLRQRMPGDNPAHSAGRIAIAA